MRTSRRPTVQLRDSKNAPRAEPKFDSIFGDLAGAIDACVAEGGFIAEMNGEFEFECEALEKVVGNSG